MLSDRQQKNQISDISIAGVKVQRPVGKPRVAGRQFHSSLPVTFVFYLPDGALERL